jgi:hypothetical protein
MRELLDTITEYAHDHWIKFVVAMVFMAAGWWFGKRRAAAQWKRREFLGRINFSLNTLQDGKLLIRTLAEKRCEEVFLNLIATEKVIAAARETTAADPTLPLPQDDYWFYLNPVLNELSEQFSLGMLRRDMGLPVERGAYLIALTSERAGEVRTQKIRAMVIHQTLLENLPEEEPEYESQNHATRWKTLQSLAKLYKTQPWKFQEVEICLPKS